MDSAVPLVALAAAIGALGGALAPRLIAALPEPVSADDSEGTVGYRQLAGARGLGVGASIGSALACALFAWRLGWSPALPMWLYLGVVGVVLGYVDARTRLLPTRLIAPSYVVVAALAVLASAVSGDWDALLRAGLGWLLAGGLFFGLWFIYPKGLGYGDVRLSGVLGIALGWLGWPALVVGVYAGFVLGAVGGALLALLRVVDRKRYPFGPFMLVGAVVGVLTGPILAEWYLG